MCVVVVKVAIWSAGTTDTWLSRIWSFSRMKLILFLDKIRTQDSHTLKRICVIPVRAEAPFDLVYIVHKLLPVQIFFLLLLSSWWAALTASGKTHSGNSKTQNGDVLFRTWSLQSIFSQTLAGKAKRVASVSCCNNVPELCHSFCYNSWLSWVHRSTMENWTRLFSFRTALFKHFIVKTCQWKNPQRC